MLKIIFLQSAIFILLAGCASNKPKEAQEKKASDVTVLTESMNFDSHGSDSLKIDGLNTIHFDFNKSSLDKNQQKILIKNAEWLKEHSSAKVQIEGHCDNRGSIEYNLSLGERRAKVAYSYLVKHGTNPKQISIISIGKEKPLSTDDSEESQAKNRRDNFVPIGDIKL